MLLRAKNRTLKHQHDRQATQISRNNNTDMKTQKRATKKINQAPLFNQYRQFYGTIQFDLLRVFRVSDMKSNLSMCIYFGCQSGKGNAKIIEFY